MRGRVVEVENAKEIIGEIGDGFQVFRFKENPAFLQSFLLLCLAQNVLSFEHHSHSYFLHHLLSSLLPKTLNPSSSSSSSSLAPLSSFYVRKCFCHTILLLIIIFLLTRKS